jgi:hypothetical protein
MLHRCRTLAEALGQVKPPVASRADIENSGLAVIKASQVKDEGASGAILAICVEQCLVSLRSLKPFAYADSALCILDLPGGIRGRSGKRRARDEMQACVPSIMHRRMDGRGPK